VNLIRERNNSLTGLRVIKRNPEHGHGFELFEPPLHGITHYGPGRSNARFGDVQVYERINFEDKIRPHILLR
jgi:hypothetical protein